MKKAKTGIIGKAMRQHRLLIGIVVVLMLAGFYSLYIMNKDEFPQFTIRQGIVVAVYPGATATQIEEQVCKPLERYLFNFSEVDKTKTYSYSEDGRCYVFVELSNKVANKDEAWSKLRHGLKDFQLTLPAGVLAVLVMDDFGNTSSLLLTLESPDKSPRELETYAYQLSDRLYTLPALGRCKVLGTQKEEIGIWIQPEKLATYGISSATLMGNLATQGFLSSAGNQNNSTGRIPLYMNSVYQAESDLEQQLVYTDPNGNQVRLGDVAVIERHYPLPSSYIRKDGHNALLLSLEIRPGNDIVAFGKAVDKVLDDYKDELPASVNMTRITDQPKVVRESVSGFLTDLVTSILIVIFVMLLLFPLRSALIAGSGVPVCTAIGLLLMYLSGIELNTVTLAALIFVLGMIVDNSIVIIDGYTASLRQGHSNWYSAVTSAGELFPPLLVATIAIVGMFFPVTKTLDGPMGEFVKLFPWTVVFTLGTSLLYAVLIVPYLEFRYIHNDTHGRLRLNMVERGQKVFFHLLQNGYERSLKLCFRHPRITLLSALAIVAAGFFFLSKLNIQMMPKAERDCFSVEVRLPYGSSIQQTAAVCDSICQLLNKDSRVSSITQFIGSGSPRFHACYSPSLPRENYAQFIVNTTSTKTTESLLADYTDRMVDRFPEAYVRFKQMDYQAVANPIEINILGDDWGAMEEVARQLEGFMKDSLSNELDWIHSSNRETLPAYKISLKPDAAAEMGVTQSLLALQLASLQNGQMLTSVWEGDYQLPVRLHICKDDSLGYTELGNTLIATGIPGKWVPLRAIANIEPDIQPASIKHYGGRRCITVAADLKWGESQPVPMQRIHQYLKQQQASFPANVEIKDGGLTQINEALIPQLALGIGLAIIVIFVFLLYDFGSLSLSILALSATFLCFFGAFFGLWLFNLDFGITSVLGVVSLIGIIVRNGIIMFEYAESLVNEEGCSVRDAAYLAGKRRMRPIFLTSATTALGVIPMITSQSTLWMPMGVIICFGTVCALPLIVTVLPVAYWQIFERKDKKA